MPPKKKKPLLYIILPLSAVLVVFFFITVSLFTCLNNQLNPKSLELPFKLSASSTKDNMVILEWRWLGNLKKLSSFIVERKAEGGSRFTQIGTSDNLSYVDSELDRAQKKYIYRIYALKDKLRSDYSKEAEVDIGTIEPSAAPARNTPGVFTQKTMLMVENAPASPVETKPPKSEPNVAIVAQTKPPKESENPNPVETPDPDPEPKTEVGKMWFRPEESVVIIGDQFKTEVHVNTGAQNIISYDVEIAYPAPMITINTMLGNTGVVAGPDGFVSLVIIQNAGKIRISGTSGTPKKPSDDLFLFSVFWVANSPGVSSLDIKVNSLLDEKKSKIGHPRGVPGSVAVKLTRLVINDDISKLEEQDRIKGLATEEPDVKPTPGRGSGEVTPYSEPAVEPETSPAVEILPVLEPTPEPEKTPNPVIAEETDNDTFKEPTPERTIEPTVEPTSESQQVWTPEPTFETTLEPMQVWTEEPTSIPTIEPTELPIIALTPFYENPTPFPEEPTPNIPAPQGSGGFWCVPSGIQVNVGSSFMIEIHANTGNKKVSAYGLKIFYASSFLAVDTTRKGGVEPGNDGFIAAVNSTPGVFFISGIDFIGKGPSIDLSILRTYWIAKQPGKTQLTLAIMNFIDDESQPIGNPYGKAGDIIIQ